MGTPGININSRADAIGIPGTNSRADASGIPGAVQATCWLVGDIDGDVRRSSILAEWDLQNVLHPSHMNTVARVDNEVKRLMHHKPTILWIKLPGL